MEKLKEEAEHMNENNIRKLPRSKDSEDNASESPEDSNR